MFLEARPRNCCSSKHLLQFNGRPFGTFERHGYGEEFAVRMLGRRSLHLRPAIKPGYRLELKETKVEKVLAWARPKGILTRAWDLDLSLGPAQLVSQGLYSTGFAVEQEDVLADVDRLGRSCQRGWKVRGGVPLIETDLLLIGLVYHILQERRAGRDPTDGG